MSITEGVSRCVEADAREYGSRKVHMRARGAGRESREYV